MIYMDHNKYNESQQEMKIRLEINAIKLKTEEK